MERIPVAGPWITEKEIRYATDAATHGWYARAGEYPARFERAFADYVGRRFAVALPSCTSAIHLALRGLGVGPGDEVIVPDSTWIATAAPISYVGATPVFADVDPVTWCLSAQSIEQCLTPRTRAIIPVDLYGGMPDYPALLALAAARGVPVIEDAAEAVGSEFHGRRAGSFGAASVFSFHGSKTLTTGEGGMLVTDDEALHRRVLVLRDHGRQPGDKLFFNTEVGYKYKMSPVQAALGLAQVERMGELLARKREIFGGYRDGLAGCPSVSLNAEPLGTLNSYWMVTAVFAPETGLTCTRAMAVLDAAGIDSRPFFHPLSSLPAYAGQPQAVAARARNRIAYDLSPRAINLPSALCLTREQVARVCAVVKDLLAQAG